LVGEIKVGLNFQTEFGKNNSFEREGMMNNRRNLIPDYPGKAFPKEPLEKWGINLPKTAPPIPGRA